jgi:hypothetical protein
VWQKAVKPYIDAGEMVAIGVVQEQHPDRTRLYRQWRELDWPIFVDSMNTLEHITVVPVPVAINQAGIVAHDRIKPEQLANFVRTELEMPDIPADYNRISRAVPDARPIDGTSSSDWHAWGRDVFNLGSADEIDSAVIALETSATLSPGDGPIQFSLGTALRRRYEGPHRKPLDNQRAVEQWGLALDANPNHYIYRRRLQQYGPRLDKPYNFYFWVQEARADIRARGDVPVPLAAEPMGSEIAQPENKDSTSTVAVLANPDPDGQINRDENRLVRIEPLVTPARVRPGHRIRARLTFRLDGESLPWWNNEADAVQTWIGLPEGIEIAENTLAFANPDEPETQELRQVEIELIVGDVHPEGPVTIPGYALYYVCEDAGGVCYYLRQDFDLNLTVDADAPKLK